MAESKDSITVPGEININRLELQSANGRLLDISAIIGDITIYEDIFSNTMSGYLLVQDTLDLVNTLPLTGEELLHVDLSTPSLKGAIKKTFYIYKLSSMASNKRTSAYMLHFCSLELINSTNTKIAKAFKGNISDTVKSILTDKNFLASEKTLTYDATSNDYQFIAPYWTPLQTINWLTTKSINKRGVSNFLFFENNSGFEYTSIDTLLAGTPIRNYFYSDVDSNTVLGVNASIDQKYNFVELINMPVTFDYIRNLSAGMYGGVLYTFDTTTKDIKKTVYDYHADFSKTNHTNAKPLKSTKLQKKKIASLHFMAQNNYLTGQFKSQKMHSTVLQRNSLLEQIRAFKFNIKVYGRTDIKAGQMITYAMPKQREVATDEIKANVESEYFGGKYLITAIRHQIINGKHSMEMEIVSDSFIKEVSL
jgi:hypothetical protein